MLNSESEQPKRDFIYKNTASANKKKMSELVQLIDSSKKEIYLAGFSRLLLRVIDLDMNTDKCNNMYYVFDTAEVGEIIAKCIKTLSGTFEGFYPVVILERMLISKTEYSNILYSALSDPNTYLQMLQRGCNDEYGAELIRLLTLFVLFSTGSENLESNMHNFNVTAPKTSKSQTKQLGKKGGKNITASKKTNTGSSSFNEQIGENKLRIDGKEVVNLYVTLSTTNFLAILLDSVFDTEITSPLRCAQALESLNVLYTSVLSNYFMKNKLEEVLKLDRTSVYTDEQKDEIRNKVGNEIFGCPGIITLIPDFRERILSWTKHAISTKDWNLALQLVQFLKICLIDISTVLVSIQEAQDDPDNEESEDVKTFKLIAGWLNLPLEAEPGLIEDEICTFVESVLEVFPNTINTLGVPKKAVNNYISAVCEFEYFAKVILGDDPDDINVAEEKYDMFDDETDTSSLSSATTTTTTSVRSKLSEMDIESVMTNVASEFSNVNDNINRSRYREGLSFQNNNVLKKAVVELTLRVLDEKYSKSGSITSVFTTRTSIIRYKFLLGVYNAVLRLQFLDPSASSNITFQGGLPGTIGNNQAIAEFLGLTYENVYSTTTAEIKTRRNEKDKRITKDRTKPSVYQEDGSD